MPISPPVFKRRYKGVRRANHNKRSSWRTTKTQGLTTTERGYGAQWRHMRDAVMHRDNYLCQVCLADGIYTTASEVDHIKPKSDGGTDEIDNLQAICKSCHQEKTKAEAVRGFLSHREGG